MDSHGSVKRISIYIVVLSVIVWSIVLYKYPATAIVEAIGIHNVYWVTLAAALLIGVSTTTSVSFYTAIVTFAIGGANPLLLGLFAGIGLTAGDSLFYYFGKIGKKSLPVKVTAFAEKVEMWFTNKPPFFLYSFIVAYSGLTPFPGDILSIFLGISGFSYRNIVIPLLIGNTLLITILAELAQRGVSLF
jgi:membrane protein YqaA with SNARE-associated domain